MTLMSRGGICTAISLVAGVLSGCGTYVPRVAEPWEASDPRATEHLEMQIKFAVFCELRDAVIISRMDHYKKYYKSARVDTKEDQPLPDSWGAQVTLTLTVDELSKLNPGVSLIRPIGASSLAQTFTLGLGATASSEAMRYDKFETYYTMKELGTVLSDEQICNHPPQALGPKSISSPFTVLSSVGIREWLPGAARVSQFLRSSRKAENGEGPALGAAVNGLASDAISYDIKFIIVSDFNVTPSLKLVRVTTPTSPSFFDTSRTRTHELLITIAPSQEVEVATKKGPVRTVVPSTLASQSHFAQEVGSAVANSIGAPNAFR